MCPACASSIAGSTASEVYTIPQYIERIASSKVASGWKVAGPTTMTPALFTSTSICPRLLPTSFKNRSTESASPTSQGAAKTCLAVARSLRFASRSVSSSRPQIARLAPRAANSRAMARPRPRDPPVTTTFNCAMSPPSTASPAPKVSSVCLLWSTRMRCRLPGCRSRHDVAALLGSPPAPRRGPLSSKS